jgi:hypothetical protein
MCGLEQRNFARELPFTYAGEEDSVPVFF